MTNETEQKASPVLFVWSQAGRTNPDRSMNNLLAFSEQQFLDHLKETDTKYVIVGRRHNFLSLYMRANPAFKEVAQFNAGAISIFAVDTDAPTFMPGSSRIPLMADYRLRLYLANLRDMLTIGQYQAFLDGYFGSILGLGAAEIASLENGTELSFRVGETAGGAKSAQVFSGLGATALSEQVALAETNMGSDPDNPWLHLNLGSLYQQDRRYADAATQYSAALDLAPTNPALLGTLVSQVIALPDWVLAVEFPVSELVVKLQSALEVAIVEYPDQVAAYLQLTALLIDNKRPEEAAAVAAKAFEKWPNDALVNEQLIALYSALKLADATKAQMAWLVDADPGLFQSIFATKPQSVALLSHEDRLDLLRQYIQQHPDEAWPRLMLGSSYLANAGALEP